MTEEPKMVEDGLATAKEAAASRERLAKAGYEIAANVEMKRVHPHKEFFSITANGFVQCFVDVDGKRSRVMDYAPSQRLQPHVHDGDEKFLIKGGRVNVFKWASEYEILAGGCPHSIFGGEDGFQFHEVVGDFNKRSSKFFLPHEVGFCLGEDGAMRFLPPAVCARFTDRHVVITGCSRGLGLSLARYFLHAGARVTATCRSPGRANALQVGAGAGKSRVLACDIADKASVQALAEALEGGAGATVDVLVNNAGISSSNHPVDPVVSASGAELSRVMATNTFGTVLLTQALLPLMRRAQQQPPQPSIFTAVADATAGCGPLIVNISSQLASIANCMGGAQGRSGGVASYRISRAANNMALRCFAGELGMADEAASVPPDSAFCCVAISPGWVATDMGSAGGRVPPLTVEQSVGGMLRTLAGVSAPSHTGKFLEYSGKELPW